MLLKKVVVVVDGKSAENYKEIFEGDNLNVTTLGITEGTYQRLEIKDDDVLLGEFAEWTYWRKIA